MKREIPKPMLYSGILALYLFSQINMSFSQSAEQNTVASSGAYFQTDTLSLSWTLGEPTTETIAGNGIILSQGFHQGNLTVTTRIEDPLFNQTWKVYPNPTNHVLNIESELYGVPYQVYTVEGGLVKSGVKRNRIEKIDFSEFRSGAYILKIGNKETHTIMKE